MPQRYCVHAFFSTFYNMENSVEILKTGMMTFMHQSLLQRLILVLLVLGLAKVMLILLRRVIAKAEMRGMDSAAKPLVYSLFSYAIYVITLLLVLHIVGVNTAGLVAMVGAASLAIGLALKDTLSNIASGLLLLFLRPFKAGDYIECGAINGKIVGIGLFNTTLETVEGMFVSAPNSSLWGQPIVNFSKNPNRRLQITVGISYNDSMEKALNILRDLVENEPLFLKKPAPQFFVSALADSSVDIAFRVWVKNCNYFELLWKYNEEVKRSFDEAGITIPFPQRTVHVEYPDKPQK
jgi:small conductance mechanosensitive channel